MDLPEAFVKQMETMLGGSSAELLASLETDAPVSIRLHPVKGPHMKFEEAKPVPWCPLGRYLPRRPVFTLDPVFHAGAYYVQEASSMILAEVMSQLSPHLHRPWALDLAGAPGGKSTLLAETLPEGGLLVANEPIAPRQQVLKYNLAKWGYPHVLVGRHDPADFAPLKNCFDLVLVDAPCSGEGMFRKDQGARKEWSPEHVRFCAARQRRILSQAVQLLQTGGFLIYSTCTFNREENESQIGWMIREFGLEPFSVEFKPEWGIEVDQWGYRFYPHRLRGEGFFLSVLQKTNGQRRPSLPKSRKRKSKRPALQGNANGAAHWLRTDRAYHLERESSDRIVYWPKLLGEDIAFIRSAMPTLRPIGLLGEIKGKDLIPAPELALSLALCDEVPRVDLPLEQALRYLRKESIVIPAPSTAKIFGHWRLMTHQHHPLGWAKVLPRRVNNYYPKGWAIRMAIPS